MDVIDVDCGWWLPNLDTFSLASIFKIPRLSNMLGPMMVAKGGHCLWAKAKPSAAKFDRVGTFSNQD